MAKLDDLLKEMSGEIPGLFAAAVVGMDGLAISSYSTTPEFDMEMATAQFSLVMKLVQKTSAQLGDDEVEDNLVTSNGTYFLTRFLGDGSYCLGVAADKNAASLGNVRLTVRQYANSFWKGIPKRK